MDDLIRREDAIKALRSLAHEVVVIDKVCSLGVAMDFISAIRELPSADRPQEWIPCSDRLPEKEGIYLITATNYIFDTEEIAVGTCYFNTEYGFSNNTNTRRKILAWMPLPKPWKGADDETD